MDNTVKQRLVGALILLALGVVFWPIIFVPESRQEDSLVVDVPAAPPVDMSPLPEPDDIGLRRGGQAAVQAEMAPDVSLPEAGEPAGASAQQGGGGEFPDAAGTLDPSDKVVTVAPVDAPLDKPALDEDGLPIAFTLQVATMAQKERAEALRDELVAAGYKGYLKRMRRGEQVLYRVLVGPRYIREELDPVKEAVDARWRVESLIMRYRP